MRDQICLTLKTAIAEMIEGPPETIDCSAPLTGLGVDSLQALQLLVLLERTYSIQIGEEELKHFVSIDSIADLVMQFKPVAVGS